MTYINFKYIINYLRSEHSNRKRKYRRDGTSEQGSVYPTSCQRDVNKPDFIYPYKLYKILFIGVKLTEHKLILTTPSQAAATKV